jgi:hypothetical protein
VLDNKLLIVVEWAKIRICNTKIQKRILKMFKIFINSLKKFKFKTKQQNGFNENYFILGDAFSISSNVLVDYKNTNYEKIEVK